MNSKIRGIDELAMVLSEERSRGLRVAHCHGVFDLMHPGHIRHFEATHGVADVLVVTLTADAHVAKGPGRPVFNQRLRAESVAALHSVDYVAVLDSPSAVEAIRKLKPDVYSRGNSRYDEGEASRIRHLEEDQTIREIGGEVLETDEINLSSTNLLNSFFSVYSPRADQFLRKFRQRYSSDEVIAQLRALEPLRVLVLGDIIIDEYAYCRAVGKSSKSPTLTARYLHTEKYAGGALAVANHVAGFVRGVSLLSYLGEPTEHEIFVREQLKPNVTPELVEQQGRPVVVKRRYVDPFQISKMFEVLWLDGEEPPPDAENRLIEQLKNQVPNYDLVIVADFGHGGVGSRTVEWLAESNTFLAVNAQTNSANTGYNLIHKYPRADYICLDEEELRLASNDRYGEIENLMVKTAKDLECRVITVTQGSNGSATWSPETGLVQTPALSNDVVDSVGAGDAYLSVTSLCAHARFDPDLIGFIGNSVGALAVQIVGNRESVEAESLYSFIRTLLK